MACQVWRKPESGKYTWKRLHVQSQIAQVIGQKTDRRCRNAEALKMSDGVQGAYPGTVEFPGKWHGRERWLGAGTAGR